MWVSKRVFDHKYRKSPQEAWGRSFRRGLRLPHLARFVQNPNSLSNFEKVIFQNCILRSAVLSNLANFVKFTKLPFCSSQSYITFLRKNGSFFLNFGKVKVNQFSLILSAAA